MDTSTPSWIECSQPALENNVAYIRSIIGSEQILCACIKANAYGHGMIEMAKKLVALGVDWVSVFIVSDACRLRNQGISIPILVLAPVDVQELEVCIRQDIRFLCISWDQIVKAHEMSSLLGIPAQIHVPVETGLGRLGVSPGEVVQLLIQAKDQGIHIEGLMQHFATADEINSRYYTIQKTLFEDLITTLLSQDLLPPVVHAANSGGTIVQNSVVGTTMVRVGAALYGFGISNDVTNYVSQSEGELLPVLSWKSRLISTKVLPAGTSISYGATITLNHDTLVGVVPVGYYDGYDRGLSNCGWMMIEGKRCPVLGRVCMNMTMIDLSAVSTATVGQEVTMIGEGMSLDQMAELLDTIPYEICSRIRE